MTERIYEFLTSISARQTLFLSKLRNDLAFSSME